MSKILVVDDSPWSLDAMVKILTRAGHEVLPAPSGEDAIRTASHHMIDVAVVDYNMPGQNGLEVLEWLRKVQPSSMRILVSGALDVDMATDAVNRGEVARVLAKPFDLKSLTAAVDGALSLRQRLGSTLSASYAASRLAERQALIECLSGDALALAAQPIVAAHTHSIAAHEVLLRSSHPVLSGPLPILRAAEHHEMLAELGARVAEMAAELIVDFPPGTLLFLNLHPDELDDPARLSRRLAPLTAYADRVVLEITERCRVAEVASWEACTAAVNELGFSLAVDDLGAGYSSLSVLAALKPRFVKIDMSLTRDVHLDRHKRSLIELICQFAATTSAQVVAEGIECAEEAEVAEACGVDLLQGYYFGRPVVPARKLPMAAVSAA